jgi:hypothetical protein
MHHQATRTEFCAPLMFRLCFADFFFLFRAPMAQGASVFAHYKFDEPVRYTWPIDMKLPNNFTVFGGNGNTWKKRRPQNYKQDNRQLLTPFIYHCIVPLSKDYILNILVKNFYIYHGLLQKPHFTI